MTFAKGNNGKQTALASRFQSSRAVDKSWTKHVLLIIKEWLWRFFGTFVRLHDWVWIWVSFTARCLHNDIDCRR